MKGTPTTMPWHLELELTPHQVWALAQSLKRATWSHYRQLAQDDEHAYDMQEAAERLRKALAEVGFAPR